MQCTSQRGLQSLAYVPLGLSSKETQTLDQWESHKYTNDRQCSALCNMHQSIVNLTALADNLIKNTASALPINFWYHLHAGVHRLQILLHSRPKSLDLTWHLHITAGRLAHDWKKWEQQGTTVFLKDASIINIAEKSPHITLWRQPFCQSGQTKWNTTSMSVVKILRVSLTKYNTMTSCHFSSIDFIRSWRWMLWISVKLSAKKVQEKKNSGTKACSLSFCCIPGSNRKTGSWTRLTLKGTWLINKLKQQVYPCSSCNKIVRVSFISIQFAPNMHLSPRVIWS
jgi:hypothetical protein